MKLRYLHLPHYKPLNDVHIVFSTTSPLQKECAIRFVVGINGSGKSHLLRALAEIFLTLERNANARFSFSLVYELGTGINRRTAVVTAQAGSQAVVGIIDPLAPDGSSKQIFAPEATKIEFGDAIAIIANGITAHHSKSFRTQAADFLSIQPVGVLAYTSGSAIPWLFAWRGHERREEDSQPDTSEEADVRPANWTTAWESKINISSPQSLHRAVPSAVSLLDHRRLKAAVFAAFLDADCNILDGGGSPLSILNAIQERNATSEHDSLRALQSRVGWGWMVGVQLILESNPERLTQNESDTADRLIALSQEQQETPAPENRLILYFDLGETEVAGEAKQIVGRQLLEIISEGGGAPFQRFRQLLNWLDSGFVQDISLSLRKIPEETEYPQDEAHALISPILAFNELSDGEQVILGRMALFCLLAEQEDVLMLLDEPETHFNDVWKREIVSIIDTAIGNTPNDVLISTHSSVVLTDAFSNEIVVMEKGRVVPTPGQTFGADPGEVMMRVFGSDDAIGKRAQDWLAKQVERQEWTEADLSQLERLISQMGPGFYRTELRAMLMEKRGNAIPD